VVRDPGRPPRSVDSCGRQLLRCFGQCIRSSINWLRADPEHAASVTRYFQVRPGGYGQGDVFIGIRLGDLRAVAKPYTKIEYRATDWLPILHSPIHEHRQLALLVMTGRAQRGTSDERAAIYGDYLANTKHINNWDLVDMSCGPIVAGFLQNRDRAPLYELAAAALIWERRIAMVGSQHFLKAGEMTISCPGRAAAE
jgi:hypothetical protein